MTDIFIINCKITEIIRRIIRKIILANNVLFKINLINQIREGIPMIINQKITINGSEQFRRTGTSGTPRP
jgi:hypothetical protein